MWVRSNCCRGGFSPKSGLTVPTPQREGVVVQEVVLGTVVDQLCHCYSTCLMFHLEIWRLGSECTVWSVSQCSIDSWTNWHRRQKLVAVVVALERLDCGLFLSWSWVRARTLRGAVRAELRRFFGIVLDLDSVQMGMQWELWSNGSRWKIICVYDIRPRDVRDLDLDFLC